MAVARFCEAFSLAGRVALVTGASSGIGRCLASALADAGAAVVVAARRVERLQALVHDIEQGGGRALAVFMDVTERASICAAFDAAQREFGVVDVVINNAGVADPKRFLKIDDNSLDRIMSTNFGGVWQVAQEAVSRLVTEDRPGSIINIASVLGLGAQAGYASYCASKGAVVQMTRALALELIGKKIRVNAIAPGWFKTEINDEYFDSPAGRDYIERMPPRRLGQLEELIGPVLLLASDAGSFVNGVILPVDGAHHAALV